MVSRFYFEEEAFWFFGDSYKAGIPAEIFVLNPREMRAWAENGVVRRWFYSTDKGEVPILPDEIIHFKEWNPWNEIRGVTPLISLSQEIEQDQRANSATTKLLRNNAVPEGILKTDQVLREEALISVFSGILENMDLDRQKEFEKLAKACIFYGTREIYEKAEAGSEWSRRNSLVKSKWEGLEQQYPNFIHLWIDDARIFALGKLGFTFYRCITKSWYGILGSEKNIMQIRIQNSSYSNQQSR